MINTKLHIFLLLNKYKDKFNSNYKMDFQELKAPKKLAHSNTKLRFTSSFFNTQDELDELREELIFAHRRIKRLKWGLAIFAAYFLFITFTFLLKTNVL